MKITNYNTNDNVKNIVRTKLFNIYPSGKIRFLDMVDNNQQNRVEYYFKIRNNKKPTVIIFDYNMIHSSNQIISMIKERLSYEI